MKRGQLKQWWVGDRWSRWFLGITLLINGCTWLIIWRFMPRNLDVSPLHYTIYFGINLTGHWLKLFWLPAIGALAIISHLIIIQMVDQVVWRRLWLILAGLINVMMIIGLTAIVLFIRNTAF